MFSRIEVHFNTVPVNYKVKKDLLYNNDNNIEAFLVPLMSAVFM